MPSDKNIKGAIPQCFEESLGLLGIIRAISQKVLRKLSSWSGGRYRRNRLSNGFVFARTMQSRGKR